MSKKPTKLGQKTPKLSWNFLCGKKIGTKMFSSIWPVAGSQGIGVLLSLPRPCSSTYRCVTLTTHRHGRPQSVCSPCSFAHLGRAPTACVSSPRDWTVCIGSHVQQDIDMSKAPPQHGAPFPLLQTAHVRNINEKNDANFSEMTVLGTCCNACLPLRWTQNGFCTE